MIRSNTRRGFPAAAIVLIVIVLISAASSALHANEKTIRIAAASSMRFVLDDLIEAYSKTTGQSNLQTIYGSSGNLYRQILQGAPYDLFLSADVQYIDDLVSKKRMDHSAMFALGTLVLQSSADVPSDSLLLALTAAVREGAFQGSDLKIAIANPAHAPFGKAAQEVLQALAIWEDAKSHLILADNVSQAAQFARTGAVVFAFVAQSLAGQLQGQSEVVPRAYYSPLHLKLGVLSASDMTHGFVEFTQSDIARPYFEKYQLSLPVSGGE